MGSLAGTGGIWNAQTTPNSRGSALVPLVTLLLLALAAAGFTRLRSRWAGTGETAAPVAGRLALVAAGGFLLASAGALPVVRDALAHPGDGQKFLMPYVLLLVLCAALGAERLAGLLDPVAPSAGRAVLVGFLLIPVAVLPDLAYGAAGRLQPVRYHADWDAVAERVGRDPGPVLSLPLSAYRAYPWNPGSVVLDPLPRYLPATVIVDDTLIVGGAAVSGENRRAEEIRRLVAAGEPVAGSGVRWVVVQRDGGWPVEPRTLEGLRTVYSGAQLTLYENPRPAPEPPVEAWRRWLVAAAGILALGVVVAALVALGRAAITGLRRNPTAW